MARPQPLVAGNWKMNGMLADLAEIEAVRDAVDAGGAGVAEVLICPPATLIMAAAKLVQGSRLKIGGQTCRSEISGAHTGDISAAMLKDAGASYVILGHSERRASYGETNAAVRARAISALDLGCQPSSASAKPRPSGMPAAPPPSSDANFSVRSGASRSEPADHRL